MYVQMYAVPDMHHELTKASIRCRRPVLRSDQQNPQLLLALSSGAMALSRLAFPQRKGRELVQCPGTDMSGRSIAHVLCAAAREGAWAISERGAMRLVDTARGELRGCNALATEC